MFPTFLCPYCRTAAFYPCLINEQCLINAQHSVGFQQYFCCWGTVLLCCDVSFLIFTRFSPQRELSSRAREMLLYPEIYSGTIHILYVTSGPGIYSGTLSRIYSRIWSTFPSVHPSHSESWAWIDSSCLEYFLYLCYSLCHKYLCPVLRWEVWARISCHLSASQIRPLRAVQCGKIWALITKHNKLLVAFDGHFHFVIPGCFVTLEC